MICWRVWSVCIPLRIWSTCKNVVMCTVIIFLNKQKATSHWASVIRLGGRIRPPFAAVEASSSLPVLHLLVHYEADALSRTECALLYLCFGFILKDEVLCPILNQNIIEGSIKIWYYQIVICKIKYLIGSTSQHAITTMSPSMADGKWTPCSWESSVDLSQQGHGHPKTFWYYDLWWKSTCICWLSRPELK